VNEPNTPDEQPADDLSQIYQATVQPDAPKALGDEIRQAAHAALQAPPAQNAWPWRQGVAVAAVLVLSVSIFVLLPREQLRLPEGPSLQAPPVSDAPLRPAEPAAPSSAVPAAPAIETKRKALSRPRQEAPAAARALESAPAGEADVGSSAAGAPAKLRQNSAVSNETLVDEAEQSSTADDARENSETLEKSYYRSSPELWIPHIERLLSDGEFEEAKREFDAFQAQHPQHPYAAR